MLDKNKQIEEIACLTSIIWEANHKRSVLDYHWLATEVYNAGYRKASDVAKEIFEEVEREIKNHGISYAQRKIVELKKKYTEGEG